ncbi:MAG: M15 family metallopeptidase [Candidatus Saccharibacteria bacterium]
MKIKKIYLPVLILIILFAGLFVLSNQSTSTSKDSKTSSHSSKNSFNKKQYSMDAPGSIWWIVNKERTLPSGYVPNNLSVPNVPLRLDSSAEQMKIRSDIAPSIEAMFGAAKDRNINLLFASGYRSEAYQRQLYSSYVAKDGQEAADRYSAKPGTSEHQTGLAFDVCEVGTNCDLEISFGTTEAGKWIAENAPKFGFIVRYQKGKEASTGYQYEPWHLRFVGKPLANELRKKNLTMEEFFNL